MDASYNVNVLPLPCASQLLTPQAAMHSIHTLDADAAPNPSTYQRPMSTTAAVRGSSSTISTATNSTATSITNHRNINHNSIQEGLNVTQSRLPGRPADYTPAVLSSRSMETMAFNPVLAHTQNAYISPVYHHGINSHISAASYGSGLGILNAESYDDRGGALRAQEASAMRMKVQERMMPFGITTAAPRVVVDLEVSQEINNGKKRRKPRSEAQSADDEEEARKKARGRPRVDTKDETAADRRRTQIRMAQRAYRHRKETTISSLEKQVQDLKGTNEEMSKIFANLYNLAMNKGLLQREPDFGQQLQLTTERVLALAKASTSDEINDDSHVEDGGKQVEVDTEPDSSLRQRPRKASPKKQQEVTPTIPIPEPSNAWGGYTGTLSKEDSPVEDILTDFQNQGYGTRTRPEDFQIITRPTEDNASFPFDFMDLQQFHVQVPSNPTIEDFSHNFLPESQPPLPDSYSHTEFSFARRIHRVACQEALKLVSMDNPPEDYFLKIFGLCLTYESKAEMYRRFKGILDCSTKETLEIWQAPFPHVGGAGTYYPMHDNAINGQMKPRFRTGFSMGPFTSPICQTQETMLEDLRCTMKGFEGDFYDSNDVEGYLRGHGLEIPPCANFITAELDISLLFESASSRSNSSILTTVSPETPRSPVDRLLLNDSNTVDTYNLDFSKSDSTYFPFGWDNDPVTDNSNIYPMFNSLTEMSSGRATPDIMMFDRFATGKRRVRINVDILIKELTSRSVCLGRSPGFRPSDMNIAIMAAVKAGFAT